MSSAFMSAWPPTASPLPEVTLPARSRKKLRWACFRWLLLGSHYLYLRRPFTQLLFWVTLGGLLLWWLIDLTRLSDLVRQHNQRALAKLVDEYHDQLELRMRGHVPQAVAPEAPVFAAQTTAQPFSTTETEAARFGFETRPGAVLMLSGALIAAVAFYVFNPPSLFPVDHAAEAERETR